VTRFFEAKNGRGLGHGSHTEMIRQASSYYLCR
jgi:hypothetical protein